MERIRNFRNYTILMVCAFSFGIFIKGINYKGISVIIGVMSFVSAFLGIYLVREFFFKKRGDKGATIIFAFIVFFLLGVLRISLWKTDSIKYFSEKDEVFLCGTISSVPYKSGTYKCADFSVFLVVDNGKEESFKEEFILYFKDDENKIGYKDKVKVYTKVKIYDTYKDKDKNKLSVIYSEEGIKADLKYERDGLYEKYKDLGILIRERIKYATDSIYGKNTKDAAIIKALLTGDKSEFPYDLYNQFVNGGFIHIMAVSGTHVSILFTLLSFLFGFVESNKKITANAVILTLIVFCSVSGLTPSVLRASIMLIIAILSVFLNKEYNAKAALFVSAFIILMIYPYALFNAGFLLSFSATGGICVFYVIIFKKAVKTSRILAPLPLSRGFIISIGALLGVLPVCLYFFKSINLTSLLTNLWIVPASTWLFCLSFVSVVCYYSVPFVSRGLKPLCVLLTGSMTDTAEKFNDVNIMRIEFEYTPIFIYVLLIIITIILYKELKKP